MRLLWIVWFFKKRLMAWLAPGRLPAAKAAWLRRRGARIGAECVLESDQVLTEPYLIDIGDRVGVSAGTCFVTHDGSARVGGSIVYGRITIGDDSFVGCNCTLLPGTAIGRDCIIGAGSVVRGVIPDGSVAMGNPARVVMTTAMLRKLAARNRDSLKVVGLPAKQRRALILDHFGLETGGDRAAR